MLIILSPAKTMAEKIVGCPIQVTKPLFQKEAKQLNNQLKSLSQLDIAKLMNVSAKIANSVHTYITHFDKSKTMPAILAFQGAVYQKLQASDFSKEDFQRAQECLLMLSGLYGCLRGSDAIAHYRLEMGSRFTLNNHKDLYEFWHKKVTHAINQFAKDNNHKYVINLASQEYAKVVDLTELVPTFISVDFKTYDGNKYKTTAIYAKQARGLLARYIIKNNIKTLLKIKKFNEMGYKFSDELSDKKKIVFIKNIIKK